MYYLRSFSVVYSSSSSFHRSPKTDISTLFTSEQIIKERSKKNNLFLLSAIASLAMAVLWVDFAMGETTEAVLLTDIY